MKKSILLAFIAISTTFNVCAQNIALSNYVQTVSDPGNTTMLESFVQLDNTGSFPIDVICERIINYIPANMDELFCFGAFCNPPSTSITTYSTTLQGGGRNNTFKADVIPNGNCGNASLHYRFFDQNDPADSIGITLNFEFCSVGLSENSNNFGLSRPLRNPADQFTVFSYNLNSNEPNDKLFVFNMLGSLVKTMDVAGKNGSIVLSTAELKPGVYFVSYVNQNKIKNSYKLVVDHK
jgi:hypothetical protein